MSNQTNTTAPSRFTPVPANRRALGLGISVSPARSITIGARLYETLGCPEYVTILFSPHNRSAALAPCDAPGEFSFRVQPRVRSVSVRAFVAACQIDTSQLRRFPCQTVDGLAVFGPLPERAVPNAPPTIAQPVQSSQHPPYE